MCENLSPGGRFAFTTVTKAGSMPALLPPLLGNEKSRPILDGLKIEPQETYEALAVANGLEMSYAVAATRPSFKFKNIDALLDYIEGIFHGRVTGLKSADNATLEKIKARYGEGPVIPQPTCCTFVLTKPMQV